MVRSLLVILIAYLLGSIPFGYLLVRAGKGADVRATGSGGTGATNVSRQAGKVFGVITLLLDATKGAAAILVARWILGLAVFAQEGQTGSAVQTDWWIAAAAVAVIIGHCFPVWLGFRGGKGVATGLGVFLMLAPIPVGMAGLVFIVIVLLTRYVSLGSIVAAATIPGFVWLQSSVIWPVPDVSPLVTAAICGAMLIVFAHRANIQRLIQGTESKFR
ncbi:MAG TPA: glycerol-3-phosphate 1-O-acyltransferase PlsY [Pyrinomonadaceae bacterium]